MPKWKKKESILTQMQNLAQNFCDAVAICSKRHTAVAFFANVAL